MIRSLRYPVLLLLLACCATAALADPVWIDVRTDAEHAEDHIDGDRHIPLAELDPGQLAREYGSDADIRLYCRSGNRAGQAQQLLEQAGFSNTTNVGGIDDARRLRQAASGQMSSAQD